MEPRHRPTESVISLFGTAQQTSTQRYSVGDFMLESCEGEVMWKIEDEAVDAHLAIARVIGGIALGETIPCVGGPSPYVQVGRMRPIHRRLLAAVPTNRWIDFGAGVWCSHDGDRLSIGVAPTTTDVDLP